MLRVGGLISLSQRFKFCGDRDVPDWVVAEISVLSKIVRHPLLVPRGAKRAQATLIGCLADCLSPFAAAPSPPHPYAPSWPQSCVRMKLICKQVINELLGGEVGFAKVQRLIPRDKGFTPADTRAALAAMNFLLRSASVNAVSDEVLNRELQQLGLPKENSDGISRPFRNNRKLLVEYLAKSSLTVSSEPHSVAGRLALLLVLFVAAVPSRGNLTGARWLL